MTAGSARSPMTWSARIAWGLLLLLTGAGAAIWGLSRWEAGARFFGVAERTPVMIAQPTPTQPQPAPAAEPGQSLAAADAARISAVESRLSAIEGQAQAAAGWAGRADAMLVAFAARRAIERGVSLGYLEPLLVQRFGRDHQAAVATIVTAARQPVRLDELVSEYRTLGPVLRGRGAEEGWWDSVRRELGSIVTFRRAESPSPQPRARYDRALAQLEAGEVDAALAETMRLPGAASASPWVAKARRYVAARRALDQVESAALLGNQPPPMPAPPASQGLASAP